MQKFSTRLLLSFTPAFILAGALFISSPELTHAATRTATTCNQVDVLRAMDQAVAGDTVQIPAGTCHWTTNINYWTAPANLTIKGAGNLSVLGGGDATVIIDDYTTNAPLLRLIINSSGTFRMSGITFQGGSGGLKDAGMISMGGPGTMRFDHLHFNMRTYSDPSARINKLVAVWDRIYGVLDNSILDLYSVSAIYIYNGSGPDGKGNTSWASDTNFGQSTFFFLEDNQVNGDISTIPSRILDCFSGSRAVVRYNTFAHSAGPEIHTTGHAGDDRGCRAMEMYGNHFIAPFGETIPAYDFYDASGGTAMVWGNTVDTDALKNGIIFNVTRKNNATYTQLPTPDRWGYCGTEFNGIGSNWDGNTNLTTGYPCIDQPGRGKGDVLTGDFPNKVNSTTGTIAWPHQVLEPIYIWMNSFTPANGWGGNMYVDKSLGRVVANRDYYPQASGIQTSPTSPFNGTSGTGWGTLANRPTTCTTGVGYFATDQGSWNTSVSNPYGVQQNGTDGVLYKCTTTNVWTLSYTPYTYPHPLTTGGSPSDTTPPSAPSSLTPSVISSSQINLSWPASSDSESGVTGYQVQRCQEAGCSNFTQIATPSSTTYSDTPLSPNTTYQYRVRAINGAGLTGAYSPIASATTPAAASFDFSLASGGNKSVTQGTSVTSAITLSLLSGTSQSASLSASGLPAGATGSFLPTACAPTCASTMNIQTSASTPIGTSIITVTATAGSVTRTTTFTLTVNAPAAGGPVGWWKLDEGSGAIANDSATADGAQNANLINGPAWTTMGKAGNAVSFDGVNDTIETINMFNMGSPNFSVSIWLNPRSSDNRAIISQSQSGAGTTQWLMRDTGVVCTYTDKIGHLCGSVTIPNNQWTHVMFTGSNSDSKIYINGVLDIAGAAAFDTASFQPPTNKVIMGYSTGQGVYLNGLLDDIRIYNRALSSTEVTNLYNSYSAGDTTPPSISMTAPINGSTLSGTATVSASASDNVGVTGVQFLLDGTPLNAEDTLAPYQTSWDTTAVPTPNGAHTLSGRARDAAGYTATAAPVSVTVSNPTGNKFSPGDRVMVTTRKLNVRAVPNGKNLGFHKQNDQGTVSGGPTLANSYTWWNVNYDTLPDGWSIQDYLEKVTLSSEPLPTLLAEFSRSTENLGALATPLTAESKTLLLSEISRLIGVIGRVLLMVGG